MPSRPDFVRLIEVLCEHEVEFILVGGVCAVVHGAPITTFDLDIVHARTPENIRRLKKALDSLGAYYRYQTRVISPDVSHLESPGHQLLHTDAGDLDVLGTIDEGRGFDDLLEWTEVVTVAGHEVRLLSLQRLIEIKERAARDKDLAVLPLLRNTASLLNEEE
jgi:predicted nucleotidyltransferase